MFEMDVICREMPCSVGFSKSVCLMYSIVPSLHVLKIKEAAGLQALVRVIGSPS